VATAAPPPTPPPAVAPATLTGLAPADLRGRFAAVGLPGYRADQVFRALWRQGAPSYEAMTVLPAALRASLAASLPFAATEVLEVQASDDGTVKWLLGLADGRRVETVLIPERGRTTVCVSTQVGCPIGCVFCASGVGGLVRNLGTAEIAEQVLHVARRIGGRPSHVVVMGMGEPLLNQDALVAAIRLWTDPAGMGFSPRRITVSTAGAPAWIDRFAAHGLGVNLAVSLHAPDDRVRARLLPGSPAGRVAGLVDAAARYARTTGRDATAEYVLIAGENDGTDHAEALAEALANRHVHVNLIPLNPVSHRPDLAAPAGTEARAFVEVLRRRGVSATLRTRRGADIAAACGQLALERTAASGPARRGVPAADRGADRP
jgi:23S rRNA (adenine2503-C2)-methyltransferase